MSRSNAERAAELRAEIRRHDTLYYVDAAPQISDLQYDQLLQELKTLELAHPELITPDSPTQRLGDAPVDSLASFPHAQPMLSIENTYSLDELRAFANRVTKLLAGESAAWLVEYKVDGVALSLRYEHGELVRGLTRGDGRMGDDVTHNVRTMREIPLRLPTDDPPELLEIRGEAYMANSDLVRLNESQQREGLALYANTRNVTAGAIRLLDSKICASRRLRFFAHGVGARQGLSAATQAEYLAWLESMQIPVAPNRALFTELDDAITHCETLLESAHALDFEIDGLVLKVNRFDQQARLGSTSKSPRWVVALKVEKYEAVTRLKEIRFQVGKTGVITPVAELDPVNLADTVVSRASLHNADEIARKDIRVGDVVVVEKAGKIIPHIVRVERHLRETDLPPPIFPKECPECGSPLVRDDGGVYIRCPNRACTAQVKERVRFFASRAAMDVEGLGVKLVDQLVDAGLVKGLGDLYQLTTAQLSELDRMGKRSAENVFAGIQASKNRGLARVLNGISIRHVGSRVASVLAQRFVTIDALAHASVEELAQVDEVGEIIAQSVYDFFHSEEGQAVVRSLRDAGVSLEEQGTTAAVADHPFQGKTFVLTGTLPTLTRDQAEEIITSLGGKASGSVSKKTHFVLAGENAGSKLEKAKELGIRILNEEEFRALIGGVKGSGWQSLGPL